MFVFVLALLSIFGFLQQSDEDVRAKAEQARQQAIELNAQAGQIRSVDDARKLVERIAEMFKKELPPPWATAEIRERLAQAEYQAISDPARLIPEERVATVWNEYVRGIGAPQETLVTPAEIHWIRDSHFAGGQLAWARGGYESIWNMPNVMAIGSDGRVANGCRPLETLRLLWNLDNEFDVLMPIVRERMRKGVLTSDLVKKRLENPNPPKTSFRVEARVSNDPVRPAEDRYVQQHGVANYYILLGRLSEELLPE